MASRLRMSMLGLALLATGPHLYGGTINLINQGFETGDLSGWTYSAQPGANITAIGSTSVTTNNDNEWNIFPAGSYMAQMIGYTNPVEILDAFFGLSAGTIASNVTDASFGDGIYQTVTGNAGDVFTMYWSLVETDYADFNDTAFAIVNQGDTNVLFQNLGCITGGCLHVVGDDGTQGWTAFTYTLPETGTYTFGFGAVNTVDNEVPPYLFLDDAPGSFINASVPEPSTYGTLGTGLIALFAIVRRKARGPVAH